MYNWFKRFFVSDHPAANVSGEQIASEQISSAQSKSAGFFSTDAQIAGPSVMDTIRARANALARTFQKTAADFPVGQNSYANDSLTIANSDISPMVPAMDDSAGGDSSIKGRFNLGSGGMPDVQMSWYSSQGFIGYQSCAMIAQQWLVSKACSQAPEDATRNGYEVTINGAQDVDPEVIQAIADADKKHDIVRKMNEFVTFGRMFGVRHALFLVDSPDKDYYEKPFNPDGITRGSYRGISQIDPYWITPMLDADAAGNPASRHFYEPTWWIINGRKYHRTHFVIMRRGHIPDVLKPSYYYGGMPLTQEIYERVYASERCANEAPQLLLTKRSNVIHTDVEKAMMNQAKFEERMLQWMYYRDNYGIKVLSKEEVMEQFDTALADLDATIMTQYQLVAAVARTPSTKLLGTSPKGFNATGEFEEATYHEELEAIQSRDCCPFLERHHLCLMRSEIAPKFKIEPVQTLVKWNELDAMTAKEQAEVNEIKSRTGQNLINAGAIDPHVELERVMNDPSSGYNGLEISDIGETREDAGGQMLDDGDANYGE